MIRQHNYHKASSTTATDTRRSGQDSSLWELPRSRSGPRAVVMEDGAQIPSLHYFPSPTSAFHELPFTDSASFSSSSLHEDEDVLEMRRMIPDLSFLDENVENDASSFPLRQSQAPHVVSTTYRESLGDVTNTI